jgi:hypothetical protein
MLDQVDWKTVGADLDDVGMASVGTVLRPAQCRALAGLYDDDGRFRSTIDMARHRFGEGEYRYFDHPLPEVVAEVRAAFWPHLLPIAREWAERLGRPDVWPDAFEEWLEQCHRAGQERPTPLLLRYGSGGWNALHRDLYGDLVFPLQVVVGLDEPGADYSGGEFVVVENRCEPNPAPRRPSSGRGTPWSSPPAIVRCDRPGDGRPHRCDTASACCVPAGARRSA